MRRIALLACAVALLGAAGCGGARAGDGDLVDDWSMLASAKVPEPGAGDCWATTLSDRSESLLSILPKTPCDQEHEYETVKVGHFTGTAADSSSPPSPSQLTDAYADCDKAAADFLGAEWQSGRVYLSVTAPSSTQWKGGARFYRCDVGALKTEAGELAYRTKTLKGTVAEGGELRLGCGTQLGTTDKSWDDIAPSACTDPHDVEFVGSVSAAAGDYPQDSKSVEAAFDKACESKLLAFTGMSRSYWTSQRSLYFGYWMTGSYDEWKAGNRSARCYLMLNKKKVNRSLKGAGNVTA